MWVTAAVTQLDPNFLTQKEFYHRLCLVATLLPWPCLNPSRRVTKDQRPKTVFSHDGCHDGWDGWKWQCISGLARVHQHIKDRQVWCPKPLNTGEENNSWRDANPSNTSIRQVCHLGSVWIDPGEAKEGPHRTQSRQMRGQRMDAHVTSSQNRRRQGTHDEDEMAMPSGRAA